MLDGSGIDFPLALDSNAVIARAIQDAGYVRTPVVLVVDRRGRVRLIDRPSWDVDGWDDANRERVIGFARSLVGVDDR
jgi:hypothetical protein